MSAPDLGAVDFGGDASAPVLVVGPSLGTSVTALWSVAAGLLTHTHRVVGWDLPGHGVSPAPSDSFTLAELADAVAALFSAHSNVCYAGVSVGGAVGLQLLLHHGCNVDAAALICTGSRIGEPRQWRERARTVRRCGTSAMRASAPERWFAPGFAERDPSRAEALLDSLTVADADGYAATCEALAEFDVSADLAAINTPVVTIAGSHDIATPPASLRRLASHIRGAHYIELPNAGHLAPAEQPEHVAAAIATLTERAHP